MLIKRNEIGSGLHTSQVAHQGRAYPSFLSHEAARNTFTPSGWDASPSQGSLLALNLPVPICTPGWVEAL